MGATMQILGRFSRFSSFAYVALFAATPLLACSSASDDGAAAAEGVTSHFEATWRPDTVVLESEELDASLLNRIAEDGVYRFRSSGDLAERLTPGKVVLLTGVNLVKITRVEPSPGGFALHTEPAALEEAAEDAHLDFDLKSALPSLEDPSAEPEDGALGPRSLRPLGTSFSGKTTVKGFDLAYELTRDAQELAGKFSVSWLPKDNQAFALSGTAKVKPFNAHGHVDVAGGRTESFEVAYDDIEVELELEAGFVNTGHGQHLLDVPATVRMPFMVGPIPMYLAVGMSIELESKITSMSSAIFRTTCTAKASGGVRSGSPGKALPIGELSNVKCTTTPKDQLGTYVDFGVGVRVDFPKIALGVGVVSPVGGALLGPSAEGYVTVKSEALANMKVELRPAGNFPVIVGTCLTLKKNIGLFAGGTVRLFGLELGAEHQLYGKHAAKELSGTGTGCPAEQ
jgi:hypothetical protein